MWDYEKVQKMKEQYDKYLMTAEQLLEESQRVQTFAIKAAEGDISFPPHVFYYYYERTPENEISERHVGVAAIMDDFNDTQKKRDIMRSIGKQCMIEKLVVVGVHLVSEAWISVTMERPGPNTIPPSQDPNRKEALQISGLTTTGLCIGGWLQIERDAEEKIHVPEQRLDRWATNGKNRLLQEFFFGYISAIPEERKADVTGISNIRKQNN